MKMKSALIAILVVVIGGIIFSGYLSYYNLIGPGCSKAIISCGPKPVMIFGVPQCVYGFFMYLVIGIMAIVAMARSNSRLITKWIFGLGIFGMAFTGGLSIYELFFQKLAANGLPACVYGFFLFLLAMIFANVGLRHKDETIQPVA